MNPKLKQKLELKYLTEEVNRETKLMPRNLEKSLNSIANNL